MRINETDRLKTLVAMDSRAVSNHLWAAKKFGANSDAAKLDFANGDTNQALIRTEGGKLIEVRYDTASPRPNGMGQFSVQGTLGAYESALGQRKVYLEGRSPTEQWEDLENYRAQFEHPMWKQFGEQANKTGHGGGDYLVVAEFLKAIRTGVSPINVVDAATWSCVRPLSEESIRGGSKAVEVPDFSRS
jgi:hypothetical protein